VRLEGLGKLEKFFHLIGYRIRDLLNSARLDLKIQFFTKLSAFKQTINKYVENLSENSGMEDNHETIEGI
jgi:hypothetical protein